MSTATTNEKTTEYLVAYGVKELGRGRNVFVRIGAAFPHKDKRGFNLEIDALPLHFDGKIVVLPPQDREQSRQGEAYSDQPVS